MGSHGAYKRNQHDQQHYESSRHVVALPSCPVDPIGRRAWGPLSDLDAFAAAWQEVAPAVRSALWRQRVDVETTEDLVQEAGLRAFERRGEFATRAHLRRFACTAARNLAIDLFRHRQRHRSSLPLPDLPDPLNLDAVALQRLRLDAVLREFPRLSAADQEVLRASLGLQSRGVTKRERDRFALQLHRARLRLNALVEGVSAGITWVRARLGDVWQNDAVPAMAAAGTAAVAVALAALVPSGAYVSGGPAIEMPPRSALIEMPAGPAAIARAAAPSASPPSSQPGLSREAGDHPALSPDLPIYHAVRTEAPNGEPIRAGTRPNPGGRPIICVTNNLLPLVAKSTCVDNPTP